MNVRPGGLGVWSLKNKCLESANGSVFLRLEFFGNVRFIYSFCMSIFRKFPGFMSVAGQYARPLNSQLSTRFGVCT